MKQFINKQRFVIKKNFDTQKLLQNSRVNLEPLFPTPTSLRDRTE